MKIYQHIYDQPEGKPNELLGDFTIIYGDMNDYSFSIIVVEITTDKVYNLVGDEVSGRYGDPQAGTFCRLIPIHLHRARVA